MNVWIVGSGKLAKELLGGLRLDRAYHIRAWADKTDEITPSIVVHAGSGRELTDIISYCEATDSVLVELSTGTNLENTPLNIPVVLCPNTNILMLKFMSMLSQSGSMFSKYKIDITESHQSSKTSAPGTAIAIAQSLGLQEDDITSVRDSKQQEFEFDIPAQHLDRHAYHRIEILDGVCSIVMETKVLGSSPYAAGVAKIVLAADKNKLEKRLYKVIEFVENGWV